MHKAEIIERLAQELGSSKAHAARQLEATLSVLTQALVEGHDVQLRGFGVFQHKVLKGRMAALPTGERLRVPERKTVRFKMAKAILDQL